MAKARRTKFDPTGFAFGANRPRRKGKGKKGGQGGGKKSNAWRAYVGGGGGRSYEPLPD